jgi:hypothetical protein
MFKILCQALLIFLLLVGLPVCRPCGKILPFFDIQGINVYNFKRVPNSSSINLVDNQQVSLSDYYISLNLEVSFYSSNSFSFPFCNSAYALSCDFDGDEGTKEEIESIQIIANYDFNENFPKGSDVSELFKISSFYDSFSRSFVYESIKNYISSPQSKYNRNYTFALQIKPTISAKQSFTFIYKLTNGETYTKTTLNVEII